MSMIKIENLTFSYPGSYQNVFENCSFQIDTDWKLGFVGRNGKGKTTLLRLLQNKYEYSGRIISSVPFDYFPCPVEDKQQYTTQVLSGVCPSAQEWEFMREFSHLDLDPDVLWRPFATLSNGEQTKALLAAFFLNEGHFQLIDEPTNHLDTQARQLVAAYLKKKKGFILVSHDRYFLDGCVDHILSLNRSTIDVQSGNFSVWMENFERRQAFEQAANDRLKKDIRRLDRSARTASVWSGRAEAAKYGNGPVDRGYIGHKAAKMMKRSKSIEARREQAVKEKSALLKDAETVETLKIQPLTHHKETLAALSRVSILYDGRAVCPPVSFEIRQGDRIALSGRNGSGKTSLLKLITGQDISHTGVLTLASGLVISHVPQDTSFLHGSLDNFALDQGLDETLFKTILRKLDFERDQFEKNMETYSGGQKKKVLIAKSLCEKAHLYIWDEPLNYVDIYSRMQIEQLICAFKPTMLFVEHDQAFQDLIATKRVDI
ncbi:MAG TPA: ABC-F type ribosomal protection protein [Candidatus Onthocola gallistercoris]|uniref:ABC-F type ribosomal protection protein n=1 Tax=Candidatus Onthocola gallistercoris TaxID=2840876 RepID=A0A9D1HH35_9FIRM|nr:ABC-F type ribosomal protection protein [Candidatus Onthocola gallistercoris]